MGLHAFANSPCVNASRTVWYCKQAVSMWYTKLQS